MIEISTSITYQQRSAEDERFAEDAFDAQIGKIILINFSTTHDGKVGRNVGEARLVKADILDDGKIAELTFEILNFDMGEDVPDADIVRAGGLSFAFKP